MSTPQPRTAVVTGANGGLGREVARALALDGWHVVLACRNQGTGDAVRSEFAAVAPVEPTLVPLDLGDLASVARAAASIDDVVGDGGLDVLVNNAGLMAIPRRETADGFEMQLGTNHLGHFALTGWLLPTLHRAAEPRVVSVSSLAHWWGWMRWRDLQSTRGYSRWLAYGQSKLANLLFTRGLADRAAAHGSPLRAVAAHPGLAATALYDGPKQGRDPIAAALASAGHAAGQSGADGAKPILEAATAPGLSSNAYRGPRGPLPLLEIRGESAKAKRRPDARSSRRADRLWSASESLTGVAYRWG